MTNEQVIGDIKAISTPILEKLSDRSFCEFRIADLEINENGIELNGVPFEGDATKSILSTLRVKKNFIEYANKMEPKDWDMVNQKIKESEGGTSVFALFSKNDNDEKVISKIFSKNERKLLSDVNLDFESYFGYIERSLMASVTEYSLKNLDFNYKDDTFNLTLLNNSDTINAFENGTDAWKMGTQFKFNALSFDYAPFFERLVCSNGNVAKQYGFGANVAQKKYNDNKIIEIIEESIINSNPTFYNDLIQKSVRHIGSTNVSLAEFYGYRSFFQSRNVDGIYDKVLKEYFDTTPFFRAYGENIETRSTKWLSSADSGINGYDFFNMITWIASHPKEVKIPKEDRLKLQIQASNILFTDKFDLEDRAPVIKVEYPKSVVMN